MLICVLVMVAANLWFTWRIWKGRYRMAPESKEIKVPRGEPKAAAVESIDYNELVRAAMQAVEVNAEESGEEETEINPEDVEKATRAVLASLGR